jgi:hypothetical protein
MFGSVDTATATHCKSTGQRPDAYDQDRTQLLGCSHRTLQVDTAAAAAAAAAVWHYLSQQLALITAALLG